MERRAQKRFAIAFVFVLLLGGTAALLWRTTAYRAPSCFDGVKNQGEVDVDCGGPCDVCRALPRDPEVRESAVLAGERGTFDALFIVENPNLRWGVKALPYVVSLEIGEDVVAERRGATFLLPLESHPVVESAIAWSGGEAAPRLRVFLGEPVWVEAPEDIRGNNLSIFDPTLLRLSEGPDIAEVRGIVENRSPFSYDRIEVHVIVRDRSGVLAGMRRTELRTLGTGERREFRVAWRTAFAFPADPSLDIVVLTNVFENENFIRAYGTRERFQEIR